MGKIQDPGSGIIIPDPQHCLVLLPVIGAVSVLLQEVILEQLGHLQRDLVRLSQGGLPHQLHNLRQVLLLLQDLLHL